MVLGYMADHRPHNPLVVGSSPTCPTFSTHTSEWVFTHYSNAAKTSFYANFTHSTAIDRHNSAQLLVLTLQFLKKSNLSCDFQGEQRELWEHSIKRFDYQHFSHPTSAHLFNHSLWEPREQKKTSIPLISTATWKAAHKEPNLIIFIYGITSAGLEIQNIFYLK